MPLPIDNRPWVPRPIPNWLIKELSRRRDDIGIQYPKDIGWNTDGNWNTYKGSMMPWVRVCSNGTGQSKFLAAFTKATKTKYNGFVLYGGNGFEDTFGIKNNKNILGYEVDGTPHQLPLDGANFSYTLPNISSSNASSVPMYLPSPGITSVEANVKKELIREITIKWNCYGFGQLEYMTPYFLTPGITVTVEFGWNHFNKESLLDLNSDSYPTSYKIFDSDGKIVDKKMLKLLDLWTDGTTLYDSNIINSKGMYDVTFGLIGNFEFSTTDGIKYDCSTTIYSKHRNFSGVSLQNPQSKEDNTTDNKPKLLSMNFSNFMEKRLKTVKDAFLNNKNYFDQVIEFEKQANPKADITIDSVHFYGGKSEDRLFFGRNDFNTNTSSSMKMYSNDYLNTPKKNLDWDSESNDDIWVTGGFLIELCNYFLTKPSDLKTSQGTSFQYYQLSQTNNIIGGHPNLITCNPSVVLIPNANTPKYINGYGYKLSDNGNIDDFDKIYLEKNGIKELFLNNFIQPKTSPFSINLAKKDENFGFANRAVLKTFQTGQVSTNLGIARDDLDKIINVFRYNKNNFNEPNYYSFPRYKNEDKYNQNVKFKYGRYGYFEDLFIGVKTIIDTAKECETVGDFWEKLLEKISDATNGFWDLKIIESPNVLYIMDQKFFNPEDFKKKQVYQFDINSARNIIKTINFTSTLSNVQANQVIAASSNNQTGGENTTAAPPSFVYGDRFFQAPTPDTPPKTNFIQNSNEIKQLQTSGKDEGDGKRYLMTFHNEDESKYNIVALALPNKGLLTAILSDDDFNNNPNVYGGQQPNFTLEMTLQGIAGFRTFQCFSIKNFPRPYSDQDVIFQIVDVSHNITNSNWETTIKASIRPLRQNIKPTYIDGSE
jgi:hypothetical protein